MAKHKKKSRNKIINVGVLAVLVLSLGCLCYCGFKVARYMYLNADCNWEYSELKRTVKKGTEDKENPDYSILYTLNPDFAGWLSIKGTGVDCPVMHTPEDPEYYLRLNFNKEFSGYGVPFIEGKCNLADRSDNILIYGHNLDYLTILPRVFAPLLNYESERYYEKHNLIYFNTVSEAETYEIISVFKTQISTKSDSEFKFYDFIDAKSVDEYNEFVSSCKEKSLYETGITAKYGDKLLTLCTCDESEPKGRMVVVAKKIS